MGQTALVVDADRIADWGTPPWSIEAVPDSTPGGCEVAVVGAGLTGLAAALTLARERHPDLPVILAGGCAGHGVALACRAGVLAAETTLAL